jgi:hypothetical protein
VTFLTRILLLICAGAGFAGAGVAAALRRHRQMHYEEDDQGFAAIAAMLCFAAALSADVAGGWTSIAAILVPIGSASYAFMAQRLGVFRIETGQPSPYFIPESEMRA